MKNHLNAPQMKSLTAAERANLENFATACGLSTKAALEIKILLALVGVPLPIISGRRGD